MLSMTLKSLRLYAAALLVLLVPAAGIASAQSQAVVTKKAEVSVSGMACQQSCAPTLHKRLSKLPDVKAVTVSAEKANAVITFAVSSKVTEKAIKQAVTEAGFTATKIVWHEGSRE